MKLKRKRDFDVPLLEVPSPNKKVKPSQNEYIQDNSPDMRTRSKTQSPQLSLFLNGNKENYPESHGRGEEKSAKIDLESALLVDVDHTEIGKEVYTYSETKHSSHAWMDSMQLVVVQGYDCITH